MTEAEYRAKYEALDVQYSNAIRPFIEAYWAKCEGIGNRLVMHREYLPEYQANTEFAYEAYKAGVAALWTEMNPA